MSKPIRTLIIELINMNGASHYKEICLQVNSIRKNIPEHSVRARLSEGVLRKELARLDTGFYDLYEENKNLTSVVNYSYRGPWGKSTFRGNTSGFLIKDLLLRFKASRVLDPCEGSGTTRDVIYGLNKYKKEKIEYTGHDLQTGFNLLTDELKTKYDFIFFHPPYHDIIKYSNRKDDLSNCESYKDFVERMRICVKKLHNALTPNGVMIIQIGDKRKNGNYTPIFNDIINFKIGHLKSIIIKIQNNVFSERIGYVKSSFLIPIKHEYVLIIAK